MPTEETLRGALGREPDNPDLWVALGDVVRRQGRLDEAGAIYETAVARDPGHARAQRELGLLHLDLGRPADAVAPLTRSVELDPDDVKARNCLGYALERCERRAEAIEVFRACIDLDPGYAFAHINLVLALERSDRISEARHSLDQAHQRFPGESGLVLPEAIVLRREGRFREAIARLEPGTYDRDAETHLRAMHELGRLYDRVGDTGKAFLQFDRLNAEATKALGLTRARKSVLLRLLEAYRSTVTDQWVSSWRPLASPCIGGNPAFLMGFARSGTTLLQQMLGSHPSIHVAGEAPAIWQLEGQLRAKDGRFPSGLAQLTEPEVAHLRQTYLSSHRGEPDWADRDLLVDKNPFMVPLVPLVARIFPGARLVFALRHPCDVVLSCFMHLSDPNPVAVHLFDLDDIVTLYAKTMDLWQRYQSLLSLTVHTTRYEDLIDDPRGTMRDLLAFLDLPWDDAVLHHHERKISKGGLKVPGYDQVREGLHRRGRFRWHRYREHLAPCLPRLEQYCRRFGYEV